MKFFDTFFIAGYECADHINASGERVNLLKETEHDLRVEEDYYLLTELGIGTVREGICWSEVEKLPYQYDFSEVLNRIKKGNKQGIQQIWDIMHFGCPADIYPTHPHFEKRFVALCEAFVTFYHQNCNKKLHVVPINEISFHAWFAGERGGTAPYVRHAGWEVKYSLCKAAISGIKAIKALSPDAIISIVEPLVQIHPDADSCPLDIEAQNGYQFQAADIILGRICPELGGQSDLIDLMGVNYYWNCQWRPMGGTLDWPETKADRTPFFELLQMIYEKYQKPLWISETGHFGEGRALWLTEIMLSVKKSIQNGIQIHGLCLYPVIDRPDWDNLEHYHNSGIWDLDANKNRIPYKELVMAIENVQEFLWNQDFRNDNDYELESSNSIANEYSTRD
jgi:beta-glucosidase/6-phospho-beta-glucosidase/beta-galactosidase